MSAVLRSINMSSLLWLAGMFLILGLAAYVGHWIAHRKLQRDGAVGDDLQIILGATLSLFGLLMGFILSIAISGYNTRAAAEENEAMAIGNAFQHLVLLEDSPRDKANAMLSEYLQLRTQFFENTDRQARAQVREASIRQHTEMWRYIGQVAKNNPDTMLGMALNACSELYMTQQKTMASWRYQIPGAAWAILLIFGLCSNFLIGYNARKSNANYALLFFIPAIMALSLFMIAQIDIPGEGIIHVEPVNLRAIGLTIAAEKTMW